MCNTLTQQNKWQNELVFHPFQQIFAEKTPVESKKEHFYKISQILTELYLFYS